MSQSTKGYLIGIVAITIWSTTGVLIGYLITNYQTPALLLSFWRALFVVVGLIPALALIRRPLLRIERSQLRFYAAYGLILALFNSIYVLSVRANGAAVSTVLAYSSAAFTAILAWWFFKEPLGLPKIAAVVLSMIGCVLVSKAYSSEMWTLNPIGIITGLVTGVLFAIYNMMGKETARRNLSAWTSLLYSFAFSAMFTLIFNLFPAVPGAAGSLGAIVPNLPLNGWLVLIVLAFIPTLLGYGLYNTAMNYLPASIVSLLATVEPVLTAVEAYIFLGERMIVVQIVGSLLILLAVIISRFENIRLRLWFKPNTPYSVKIKDSTPSR